MPSVSPDIKCAHVEVWPLEKLIEHPKNPNKHPKGQLQLLAKVIATTGWRAPVVVSRRSGFIIKGHGRFQAAKMAGMETAPVDLQDYASEAEEWQDMVADNRLAELAEIDEDALKDLLKELSEANADLEMAGFDESALADLLVAEKQSDADAEPQIDKAEELRAKWGVELGQVWQLGEHRITCGDSTSAEVVKRLLGEDKPHLMVTDPPYGVEYDASWRKQAMPDTNPGKTGGMWGKVSNDDKADWREAWALFPGDVAYVWHAGNMAHIVAQSLLACDLHMRAQIIWAKHQFVIGRGDYHPHHEPCWYAVRKGATGHYNGDRTQSTLWEIDKPQKSETGHSTQKPIECMERPIRNNSKPGDLVYEPFSGSGTTIIACERTGRKCRAIELNPAYVAVAIQRWVDATGREPKKING